MALKIVTTFLIAIMYLIFISYIYDPKSKLHYLIFFFINTVDERWKEEFELWIGVSPLKKIFENPIFVFFTSNSRW